MSLFIVFLGSMSSQEAHAVVAQKQVQNSGLIGYWSLDTADISGASVLDKSGNKRNGTAVSSPSALSPAKVKQGLTLNGSGQYIDLGTSPITGTQAFTLAAWIKPSAFDNAYHAAVSMGDSSASQSAYIGLVGSSPQGGTANTIGGGIYGSNFGTGIVSTEWSHVVMTFSGGNGGTLTIYVNGVSRFTTTLTPDLASTTLRIGRLATDTIYDFSGGVDEVYVYNRSLSSAEVNTLYRLTQSTTLQAGDPHFASVVALLHGNGTNGGTTFTDVKGHAFTRLGNSQTSTVQKKFGSASLLFDGASDYISSVDSSDWDLTTPFTIEGWFYPNTVRYSSIISRWNSGNVAGSSFAIITQPDGNLVAWIPNATDGRYDGGNTTMTLTGVVATSTWQHFALTWDGSTYRLFINGGTPTTASRGTGMYDGSLPLVIGNLENFTGLYDFDGYIDDIRITKGVARYTAPFTPPTSEFLDRVGRPVTGAQAPLNTKLLGPVNGLIGHWTFDGPRLTSTTAINSASTTDGTLVNSPRATQGIIGQALRTGNSTGYVNLGDAYDMGTNSMTLSVWFKSTQMGSGVQGMISKALYGNTNGRYALTVDGANLYAFLEHGSYIQAITPIAPYNDGKWHLATATYNRSGLLTLYVDAVAKATSSISSLSGINMQTNCIFLIGNYNSSACTSQGGYYFPGSLDDVRVYNRALSASEVMQLYKMGTQ